VDPSFAEVFHPPGLRCGRAQLSPNPQALCGPFQGELLVSSSLGQTAALRLVKTQVRRCSRVRRFVVRVHSEGASGLATLLGAACRRSPRTSPRTPPHVRPQDGGVQGAMGLQLGRPASSFRTLRSPRLPDTWTASSSPFMRSCSRRHSRRTSSAKALFDRGLVHRDCRLIAESVSTFYRYKAPSVQRLARADRAAQSRSPK